LRGEKKRRNKNDNYDYCCVIGAVAARRFWIEYQFKFSENGQYGPCIACHSPDPDRFEPAWDNLGFLRKALNAHWSLQDVFQETSLISNLWVSPQVAEKNIPRSKDMVGECLFQGEIGNFYARHRQCLIVLILKKK